MMVLVGDMVHWCCHKQETMKEEDDSSKLVSLSAADSPSSSSSSSTRALSRKNRVFIFREFLLETYGDYLSQGSSSSTTTTTTTTAATVLDVAGGKGDLSWLLCNVDGINSVVADPRVTKQIHLLRSVDYLRQHPDQVQIRSVPGLPTFQPLATLMPQLVEKAVEESPFVKPRHLRLLVDQDLVNAVQAHLCNPSLSNWEEYWSRAVRKALTCQTLGYQESSSSSVNQITDAATALETILQTRLIVGFHPDQATEASIDLALVLGIPFCVVPCCVFPAEFPTRTNPDGSRLRTYQQLLQYLKRKADHIRTADLDFPFTETAKNRVLYTTTAIPTNKGDCL